MRPVVSGTQFIQKKRRHCSHHRSRLTLWWPSRNAAQVQLSADSAVLLSFQQFLRERGGRLCFLQSRETPGASDENDVDMAVDRRTKELLPAAFAYLKEAHGQRLVQALQWDVPFSYYFVFASGDAANPHWLRPDISWDPERSSANFISTETLLDHCVEINNFVHLQPDVEWAYQVFKRLRKGGASVAQMTHARLLQQHVDSLSPGHHLLEQRLPRALVHEIRGAIEDEDRAQLRRLALLARPLLRLPQSASQPLSQLLLQRGRARSRLQQPPGLVVWLTGLDPVDARQKAERLAAQLAPLFRARHRIAPLNRGTVLRPKWLLHARLARTEILIRTVHPNAPKPRELPANWGVEVAADECATHKVLLHLHERMDREGWYASAKHDS